ncbi:MAG: lipoyl synthase [Nitrospiraceae bacterium]|nr:lipoyl synthase [Nitrospiraceae bacterium]
MKSTASGEKEGDTGKARLPPWFKIRLTVNDRSMDIRSLVRTNKLHTVCQSAACPNQTECWNAGTATFLILGNVCTRGCRFCNVPKGMPKGIDPDEPNRVARAVEALGLKYAVITSVTRDDLPDGGASIFALTIDLIRVQAPGCRVEVLIPDFQGSEPALATVLQACPDVLNHNLETVPSRYSRVRPQADYHRSLELLARARALGAMTKSGLMLGFGESAEEIRSVFRDLRSAGCSILTLGQYLQPGKSHLPVEKYYHPEEFESIRNDAVQMGFKHVVAGPLVRSSYHAGKYYEHR